MVSVLRVTSSSSKQRSIQATLLNLGCHFALSKEQWPDLWAHLERLLSGQQALMPMGVMESGGYASHCFARLVARGRNEVGLYGKDGGDGLACGLCRSRYGLSKLPQPNTIGVEHFSLATTHELAFELLLESLGINGMMRAAIVGSIIARISVP